jgi:hypothetical protein
VLSSEERRIWADIEGLWAEEADEPPGAVPFAAGHRRETFPDPVDPPVAVVVGAGIAILLLLFGVALAGLGVAATTALGWAAWRHWPRPWSVN